jgi:hypothetical protein
MIGFRWCRRLRLLNHRLMAGNPSGSNQLLGALSTRNLRGEAEAFLRIRRLAVILTGCTHGQQMYFNVLNVLCVRVVEMQDSAVGPRVDPARGG